MTGIRRDAPEGMKWCKLCDSTKEYAAFYKNRRTWNECSSYCKPCTDKYNRERAALCAEKYETTAKRRLRRWHVKREFGLTAEQYEAMVQGAQGLCAICKKPESTIKKNGTVFELSVDHNHATGATRGLLCRKCNSALGHANDDPALLRAMADYIEQFS